MPKNVCYDCIEDSYLSDIVQSEGQNCRCAVCSSTNRHAISIVRLGEILEPIMRQNLELGENRPVFYDDDSIGYEQNGDSISFWVQEFLGQYFDFEEEIVSAVIAADNYWPSDGGEAFWDDGQTYEKLYIPGQSFLHQWKYTLSELQHSKRFFSPAARKLFTQLFDRVDLIEVQGKRKRRVARTIPPGTTLFRARSCNSKSLIKDIVSDPLKHAGPPPASNAHAGRMNADGITVLYAALDLNTCMAEVRPAIGGELAVITLRTTRPLRILDFSLLDIARDGRALSYFQPDYTEQLERRTFLRMLHSLISQPIVPGHEAEYLITQTMSEYLAHVHPTPFDGVLFRSVQRSSGKNIVLFPGSNLLTDDVGELFGVSLAEDKPRIFSTTSVSYKHAEQSLDIDDDGIPWLTGSTLDIDDDWFNTFGE